MTIQRTKTPKQRWLDEVYEPATKRRPERRRRFSTLSDERRIEPGLIEQAALEEPGVLEAHNVRSRGPDDDIHLDLHVLVEPRMGIADAHAVGHRVEDRLRARWPGLTDVVVHVEPALASERAQRREGGGLKARG